jgi:mannose-1-phosphate guanylyltransferase/mannose-6-phosphate isomerase
MLVAPSDHVIPDDAAFRAAVAGGGGPGAGGRSGHVWHHPDPARNRLWLSGTGPRRRCRAAEPQPLSRFVEKPDARRAAAMLASGQFLWNAGIFLFTAGTLIRPSAPMPPGCWPRLRPRSRGGGRSGLYPAGGRPLGRGARHLDRLCDHGKGRQSGGDALCARAGRIWAAGMRSGRKAGPDAAGNVTSDHATAIGCDRHALALGKPAGGTGGHRAEGHRRRCHHRCRAGRAQVRRRQRVKDAVAALKAPKAAQATQFPTDHRPWGMFESLVIGSRFQVKRIVVHPGAALVAAKPSPPVGTLDRGRGHGPRHHRRYR